MRQIFELVIGRPPFDSVNTRPTSLVSQMMDLTSDAPPKRWKYHWLATEAASMSDSEGHTLQSWLDKVYFDKRKCQDLSQEGIEKVGEILKRLLVFEPGSKASAADVLRDPWFHDEY
jgi:serine/threonine protein kinase